MQCTRGTRHHDGVEEQHEHEVRTRRRRARARTIVHGHRVTDSNLYFQDVVPGKVLSNAQLKSCGGCYPLGTKLLNL